MLVGPEGAGRARRGGGHAAVERCFAFLKRRYGLKCFQVRGAAAVWRYALLVHAAVLAVALSAYRSGRPDLLTARAQVLAFAFN